MWLDNLDIKSLLRTQEAKRLFMLYELAKVTILLLVFIIPGKNLKPWLGTELK